MAGVFFDIFFRGNSTSFEAAARRVVSIGSETSSKLEKSLGQRLQNYFSAGAVALYARNVVNFADEITDLSTRLEVSTQTLQEWGYAAQRNGSKLEAVTKFFEALAVAREKALNGDEGAQNAFSRIGISDSALRNPLSQVALGVAGSIRSSGNVQELIPSLKEIGGKGAMGGSGVTELIPAMKSGIEEMGQAGRETGAILNDELLERIKQLKNETKNISEVFKGPMARAIAFIGEQLRNMFDLSKLFFGGIGTLIGAVMGGASLSEIQQIMSDFANSVADERLQRDRSMQQQADLRKNIEQQFKFIPKDKFFSAESDKIRKPDSDMNLSGWQRLGAAVRIANENKQILLLQRIERNTADTASRIKVTRSDVLGGNFTGAFGP